jgi:RNA polymerase sigma factor (TIGR02999 family)
VIRRAESPRRAGVDPIPADPRSGQTVTDLLAASRRGDATAFDQLLPLVYDELHAIAARHMRGERPDHTLQPTALVHEAFLRLTGAEIPYDDRAHFIRAASQSMRRVLVDHARARNAAKRGGNLRVTLDESLAPQEDRVVDLLVLDDALNRLAAAEPRWARVVELRFFGGLEVTEVAAVLGISTATAKRDWQFARTWLAKALRDTPVSTEDV